MIELVRDLGVSDLGGGGLPLQVVLATGLAHMMLGSMVAYRRFTPQVVAFSFGGWLAKEVFADLAGADFVWIAVLDSAADLSLGVLGFALSRLVQRGAV